MHLIPPWHECNNWPALERPRDYLRFAEVTRMTRAFLASYLLTRLRGRSTSSPVHGPSRNISISMQLSIVFPRSVCKHFLSRQSKHVRRSKIYTRTTILATKTVRTIYCETTRGFYETTEEYF